MAYKKKHLTRSTFTFQTKKKKMFSFLSVLGLVSISQCVSAGLPIPDDMINNSPELQRLFIFTKWCGPGNTSTDSTSLGFKPHTDLCCREHDFCPDIIEASSTKHNLTNDSWFSRLHCECDDEFLKCLKNAAKEEILANAVGKIYFNLIKQKCFRLDYPVIGCKENSSNESCTEYEYDKSGEKIWQWFSVPKYRKEVQEATET